MLLLMLLLLFLFVLFVLVPVVNSCSRYLCLECALVHCPWFLFCAPVLCSCSDYVFLF